MVQLVWKMNDIYVLLIAVVVIVTHVGVKSTFAITDNSCGQFDKLVKQLNNGKDIEMHCNKLTNCKGMRCYGIYAPALIPGNKPIRIGKIPFCLQINVLPCVMSHSKMDLYVKVHGHNITFNRRVNEGLNFETIGDMKLPLGIGETVTPKLQVYLHHMSSTSKSYQKIQFGIKLMPYESGVGFTEWLHAFDETIIPNTTITVPSCVHSASVPLTAAPKDCKALETFPKKATKPSARKKIACRKNALRVCGELELCNKRGFCECDQTAHYDFHSKRCNAATNPNKPPPLVPDHDHGNAVSPGRKSAGGSRAFHHSPIKSETNKQRTVIIACSSIAAVIVIAAITIPAVIYVRKRRSRYADHDILLTNDDDDDVAI